MTEQSEEKRGLPRTVLIIDHDKVVRQMVKNHLTTLGVKTVTIASDGSEAWELIFRNSYEFIIMDWNLTGVSGITLFNRLRTHANYQITPIMVLSGMMNQNDFRLLQEFPCTELLEMPYAKMLFESKIQRLFKESQWYKGNAVFMETLEKVLDSDKTKAKKMIQLLMEQAPNPIPVALMAGKVLVAKGHTKIAEQVYKEILERDNGCVLAMGELGKLYYAQEKHEDALDILRLAQRLSVKNVERLCLLGEVELTMKNTNDAKNYFNKALEIDPDHGKAQAGILLSENMDNVLGSGVSMANLPKSFAAIMNMVAITFVNAKKFDRGINQYHAALKFLTDADDRARVLFNLGLGYIRWEKPKEAKGWFQKSAEVGKTFTKGKSYVERMTKDNKALPADAAEVIAITGEEKDDSELTLDDDITVNM